MKIDSKEKLLTKISQTYLSISCNFKGAKKVLDFLLIFHLYSKIFLTIRWNSSLTYPFGKILIFLTFFQVGDHPYITSAKELCGQGKKLTIFPDVQYCIYAEIVGGSEKVGQKKSKNMLTYYILGWSLLTYILNQYLLKAL